MCCLERCSSQLHSRREGCRAAPLSIGSSSTVTLGEKGRTAGVQVGTLGGRERSWQSKSPTSWVQPSQLAKPRQHLRPSDVGGRRSKSDRK